MYKAQLLESVSAWYGLFVMSTIFCQAMCLRCDKVHGSPHAPIYLVKTSKTRSLSPEFLSGSIIATVPWLMFTNNNEQWPSSTYGISNLSFSGVLVRKISYAVPFFYAKLPIALFAMSVGM